MSDDDVTKSKEELKNVLSLGMSFQVISATIGFALRKDKADFMKGLGDLLQEFQNSLNEEEKKELMEDIGMTLDEKTGEILDEMSQTMTDEEIDDVVNSLSSDN